MATVTPPTPQLPKTLEPPPRSTNDAQSDYPLLINWIYKAYQNITGIALYIQAQVVTPDFNPTNLPDPSTATTASAQLTANQAYDLAGTAKTAADAAQATATAAAAAAATAGTNATAALAAATAAQSGVNTLNALLGHYDRGTVTITGGASSATVTLPSAQPDTDYRAILQAITSSGAPALDVFVVVSKSYTINDFTFNIGAAPGGVKSVTYEWQIVRKS